MPMSEAERRRLWVKAGGRCTLCKRYLLEGSLTSKEVFVGEGAHIVGQQATAGSPRGLADLPEADRDKADNIMLTCSDCHTEIDKAPVAALLTVEELQRRKRAHEDEIFHQTGLTTDRRSTVLRVQGWVRGAAMELSRDTAATAVIRSSDRFPFFIPAYHQQGIEIDLRNLDGEETGERSYYEAARRKIEVIVAQRVHEGIRAEDITHLSVFAVARLPLLVLLGWALEDGIATDVYQRHRSSGTWQWPVDGPVTSFEVRLLREGAVGGDDAVLITNLSGTTHLANLPSELHGAPVFQLSVAGAAHEDVIANRESLARFEQVVRQFFSGLEVTHRQVRRLHVFGALPVSAAVTLGRSLKARDLRPAVVLYDLTDAGYRTAMEV
jgi:hypothetical protein